MSLSVTDDAMRAIVAKAIFETMSKEDRDQLLAGAIKSLLETPKNDNYGRAQPSRLEQQFDSAAYMLCGELAREMFKTDVSIRQLIERLLSDVVERTFKNEEAYDGLVNSMAKALQKAFTSRD